MPSRVRCFETAHIMGTFCFFRFQFGLPVYLDSCACIHPYPGNQLVTFLTGTALSWIPHRCEPRSELISSELGSRLRSGGCCQHSIILCKQYTIVSYLSFYLSGKLSKNYKPICRSNIDSSFIFMLWFKLLSFEFPIISGAAAIWHLLCTLRTFCDVHPVVNN